MTDIIPKYTRERAIADGVLVDVSMTAQEAGFQGPVAVTERVWWQCVAYPGGVPVAGENWRLWEILWMLRAHLSNPRQAPECLFPVLIEHREGPPQPMTLKAVMESDQAWKSVITIMLPDEEYWAAIL